MEKQNSIILLLNVHYTLVERVYDGFKDYSCLFYLSDVSFYDALVLGGCSKSTNNLSLCISPCTYRYKSLVFHAPHTL